MRWPWRRKHDDAQAELERAQDELGRVREQWPDVHRVSSKSRQYHEANHIAPMIRSIYEGGKR